MMTDIEFDNVVKEIEDLKQLSDDILIMENYNGIFYQNKAARNRIKEAEEKLNQITFNSEIAKKVKTAISDRVNEILDIKSKNDKNIKYRRGFIAQCYKDAKDKGVMYHSIYDTPRLLYKDCLAYVQIWTPKDGIEELKDYIDLNKEIKQYEQN